MKSFNRLFIVWGIVVTLIFGSLITFGYIYQKKVSKYHKFEGLLEEKASDYLSVKNINAENARNIKVTIDDMLMAKVLKKNEVVDTCSGYVLVNAKSSITYKSQIKCKYYKSAK